ncbi:MAG: hypothetical protein ACOX5X_01790 [Acholeplasmataceae bacterium]|jgi:hypothetical protein
MKNKVNKLGVIFVSILLFLSLTSCKRSQYDNEITAITRFLKYHQEPVLAINTLEKHEISKSEIYYFVNWGYPEEDEKTRELLIVYNPKTKHFELSFFPDMEMGLSPNVKKNWD